jgi:hypothetical protein
MSDLDQLPEADSLRGTMPAEAFCRCGRGPATVLRDPERICVHCHEEQVDFAKSLGFQSLVLQKEDDR